MDVFSNVLQGTRQYFMGLPKQAQADGAGQPLWPAGAPPPEEGAPAQSGAPTPSSRPPSAAAAPPAAPCAPPPRPPSEPLEPEPHIIHKATVMREAAEKRRERPEPEDDDEPTGALSPPSHIIRKPPSRALPSPAAAPGAPSPSPARPPSAASSAEPQLEPAQYRAPAHRGPAPATRPPDHFGAARPPDPYSASRPPESYARYHYESCLPEGGRPGHAAGASPQPPRLGPPTYSRLSSALPPHAGRLRDGSGASPPAQRYVLPPGPLPPHNDRVPPIHHPHVPPQRTAPVDSRTAQYPTMSQRREPSPYARPTHYERHPSIPQRKYDPQQAYPGYRPGPTPPQPIQSHRADPHHRVQYKHTTIEAVGAPYPPRSMDRVPVVPQPYPHETRHPHEAPRQIEFPNMSRTSDTRGGYPYPTPSTSSMRYAPPTQTASVPIAQNSSIPTRVHRPATAPKSNYETPVPNQVQTSPARSTVKPGYPNQQARMTVSVTSLVNEMNQTKQKRESPLDLSVKTVKNSADSSTTQDDVVDSATVDIKTLPLQPRPPSNSRHVPVAAGYPESHKVDFAPDFNQYRERSSSHSYGVPSQPSPHPVRYNGSYEAPRPVVEPYSVESRHPAYPDRSKYPATLGRADYVPRIDLTRPTGDERRPDNKIRDDRNFIIEERKRPAGPIVSNIPEKIVRYETWSADSRIDRMSQSAREQHELMSRPVYSYSSHKQFEAYQNEQKRIASSNVYREHSHINNRYSYPTELPTRDRNEYHSHYHDRNPSSQDRNPSNNNRHVIQKTSSHRDLHPHHLDPHSGIPADKRVLSILRSSLETKQTGFVEPAKPARQIPDVIVLDDADDPVIEITDLTKDNDSETAKTNPKSVHSQIGSNLGHHIQMPKAVDSLPRDSDYQRYENSETKSKSPENDVASRIRTKAELKVMPPSQDPSVRPELNLDVTSEAGKKILPKSQKQHLFNQIREDRRLESVIKNEKSSEVLFPEVKSEPMNIDEIEKDAVVSIKTENNLEVDNIHSCNVEDLDWASACDSFMEQLKTGCHKKKTQRKRVETLDQEMESAKLEPVIITSEHVVVPTVTINDNSESELAPVVIKQEPVDDDEIKDVTEPKLTIIQETDKPEEKLMCNSEEPTEKEATDNMTVTPIIKSEPEKDNTKASTTSSVTESNKKVPIKKNRLQDQTENDKDQLKIQRLSTLRDEKGKGLNKVKKSLERSEKEKDQERKVKKSCVDENEKGRGKSKKLSPSQEAKEKVHSKAKKSTDDETGGSDKNNRTGKNEKNRSIKRNKKELDSPTKDKTHNKIKIKTEKNESSSSSPNIVNKELTQKDPMKTVIKEEAESTDDDEPLIKSKQMKEKEIKYQLLKDLSEKSAYVKLECFDVDMNKNTRISVDSLTKDKEEKQSKGKSRQISRTKGKAISLEHIKSESQHEDSSSNSDDEDLTVASRLRLRKNTKTEDSKGTPAHKTPVKSSPSKKHDNSSASSSSTPVRKPGFGDGSDFHPGWEEELYKYKRSLRMPTRLIAIPRGRSGGPFVRGSGAFFTRGSTSLPDLDPAPLSPAPSSAPSAATDDLYARRQDKLTLDSDLESNSSSSAAHRLQYDSEASSSTVFSTTKVKKKASSIVDVLIKKCGKKEDTRKKNKEKDDKTPKIIQKSSNPTELLPTPSLGLVKNGNKGSLSAKKEKLMEDIFYLGAFRKETVTAFRNAFIKNTDGLIGATEEFSAVVLKSRTRTESRVLKQRATIKEVFGDERPASAPPTSCREQETQEDIQEESIVQVKKELEPPKPKLKPKKIIKDKLLRRSSSIRDGLRSTKSLKRNDAKGRLMRLKKRNSLMKSLANKRIKDLSGNKIKREKSNDTGEDKDKPKEEGSSPAAVETNTKRRLKRLFGRRKFSSGFDYIRKKKKIIRREDKTSTPNNKIRRPAIKPSPESVHDIQKEIKGWFINKSIGETHLHRAARLGYTDCVAYCLEKMEGDPSAKDNAGFTPLHVAAAKGHVRISRLLLQYGANVSAAAQGGIRPLHEASENCHVEVIRLLLAYGADPLLGTYAGQTPVELAEGLAARFLRLHIADVQGQAIEPWRFPPLTEIIDREVLGCDPLSSPPPASPPPPPESMLEIQCTEAPLPPFYTLKPLPGHPPDGLWCLLSDITNLLQIKSKESLLKQIHCGSGSPKELLREIRTQEFLERAQCHQLLCAGEKVNVRASKVSLVRVTDKLRQLLKIETELVS